MTKYITPSLSIGTWDLNSDGCASADTDYQANLIAESLEVAGAKVNVFKMLGVHEQGKLVDLTGLGNPLSSVTAAGFLLSDAFTNNGNSWVSSQTGMDVLTSGYIGYSFGTKKTVAGTEKYNPPEPVLQQITTMKIQQGANTENRVLQARVERSDDGGVTWKRVDVVNLPDTNNLETIDIRQSAPSQMWRLVPLMFNGVQSNTPWEVVQLQMMDYTKTDIRNIEDPIFNENRDRDYATSSIQLRARYDLLDVQTELSKFGIDIPEQYIFEVSFARMVELIGRPVVIGDLVELPSEMQYSTDLTGIRKYLEVTDTAWDPEGYSTGWKPLLFKFYATPTVASQETKDVLGTPNSVNTLSDDDFLIGDFPINLGPIQSSENIEKTIEDKVPETGTDTSDIRSGMSMHGTEGSYDGRDYMVEDALPPNNQPYGEGQTFPQNPADGDYFRLTYDPSYQLPAKLYQWNAVKARWVYLETDRRAQMVAYKPSMQRILQSASKINPDKMGVV